MVVRKPARAPRRSPAKGGATSIWDELAQIGKAVPKKDRATIPPDAARNFDHYLDGSPKQA